MKTITVAQLKRAIQTSPQAVRVHGYVFIRDSVNAIKQEALTRSPWKVGQMGGGAPRDTGDTRGSHHTKVQPDGLSGEVYVQDSSVPYAKYVHGNSPRPVKVKGKSIMTRPWLDYAAKKSEQKIDQNFNRFADEILKHIAA